MSELMEMLTRRGFFWQSFEIYGGISGFFDYGPLGNVLRRKIEDIWRKHFVTMEKAVEIDTPTVCIEDVFVASGHVSHFTDVAIECEKCGKVFRADHYIKEVLGIEIDSSVETIGEIIESYDLKCECGGKFRLFHFNLMFSTKIGPGKGKRGYLRPETAQGIFIDFKRLLEFCRQKLPFGIAQIGRAYRNEISPRQGVIRLREFNQAELEYFVNPKDKFHPNFRKYEDVVVRLLDKRERLHELTLKKAVDEGVICHELMAYFIGKTREFLIEVGIDEGRLRFRQHRDDERAHYAIDCWDAEVLTSYGWIEVVGIADRTDYDLKKHAEHSGEDLRVFVQYEEPLKVKRRKIIPNMRKLGPAYRDKAKVISERLSEVEVDGEVEFVVVNVEGEEIEIPRDFFEIKEVEEEIHGEKIFPHVIEPSFGLDRITYAVLEHCFDKDFVDGEERRVLRLRRWIAPIPVAVLPLLSREPFTSKAKIIAEMLRRDGIYTDYDDSGSIGRRYRRFDEIGTPFCITVDHQTFEDETVTIRDRDTTRQIRVKVDELSSVLRELLESERDITEFGVIFRD